MKLVTLGIDKKRNLIIQFPIFVQPYTQQPLILYQLETVPVLVVDKNTKANSYMEILVKKPYITLNSETYLNIHRQELATCKRIGYEFYCKELFVVRPFTVVRVQHILIKIQILSRKIVILFFTTIIRYYPNSARWW